MSVSTSNLAKQLKDLLGAGTNAEVLERARELAKRPEPQPEPLVIAVQWRPGEEVASLAVLAGGNPPIRLMAEALRRGQAVLMQQAERVAAERAQEAERLRRQLSESEIPVGDG